MKLMVRALLADRFQLKLHHERKPTSAYVISVGKTAPKLFPSKDGEATLSNSRSGWVPIRSWRVPHRLPHGSRSAQLTDAFARQLGSVIVNNTRLDGEFDFTLDLTPDDSRPNPMDPTLLLTAMQEQLSSR